MLSTHSFVSKHFKHKGNEQHKEALHPSLSSTMTSTTLAFTSIDSINILGQKFLPALRAVSLQLILNSAQLKSLPRAFTMPL